MSKSFAAPGAFRQAIEARLKQTAEARGVSVNSMRLKFAIERLLARLFAKSDAPWLLKGGYAMELRYRPKARTTKDLDLTVKGGSDGVLAARLVAIRDELQAAADVGTGDFLEFRIGAPKGELQGPPDGGASFPVEATLAGRSFALFHLDLGFGDAIVGTPELLEGDDFLGFAGITPAHVLAIPKEQQFAEKIHAYTYPWSDRPNTRTKDLVDMLLLIQKGVRADEDLRRAIQLTFDVRKKHSISAELQAPPRNWQKDFEAMSKEVELSTSDLDIGFGKLSEFWKSGRLWER